MKDYGQAKHKHISSWFCWCVNDDNRHRTMYYASKDKINRKYYRKQARRKNNKIIKEQQDE